MQRLGRWALALGLCTLGGCAHAATGTLGPDYFKHNESGYELIYAGAGPEQGLGPGWSLDNYRQAPARGGQMAYFPRQDEGYGFDRRYDFDGDGLPDHSVRRAVYDLRYVQDGGQGVIWTRSIVLASSLEGKALKALAHRYLSKVSRVGAVFPHFGEGLPAGVAEERFSVEGPLDVGDCQVANVDAYRLDFTLRGEATSERVALVLMRPGYHHSIVANGKTHTHEVVLLAAYANAPDAFEASAPAFDGLLDRLSLARGQRPHSCRASSPVAAIGASDQALPPAAEAAGQPPVAPPPAEPVPALPGE